MIDSIKRMSIRNNYNGYKNQDNQNRGQYYAQILPVNGRVPLSNRMNIVNNQQKPLDHKCRGNFSKPPLIVSDSYSMVNSKVNTQTIQHKQNGQYHSNNHLQVLEVASANNIVLHSQDGKPSRTRYMANAIKPESTKSLKNPVINACKKKTPETYYKLSVPLLKVEKDASKSNTQKLAAIIRQNHVIYHRIQPIKLGYRDKYAVTALEQLTSVIERYQYEKPLNKKRSLVLSNYTSTFTDRIECLLLQENVNDSIDLSFDGKAINKSDFLRMMDSFSLALDDEKNDNEQYAFLTGNILPRDIISGVYELKIQ